MCSDSQERDELNDQAQSDKQNDKEHSLESTTTVENDKTQGDEMSGCEDFSEDEDMCDDDLLKV